MDAPPFEIGGNVSGIVAFGLEDGPAVVVGGGPRVTINVTPRLAIDLMAEVIGPDESGTLALYQTPVQTADRRRVLLPEQLRREPRRARESIASSS